MIVKYLKGNDNMNNSCSNEHDNSIFPLDILAIGAHRDDCELMAGGTIIKMIQKGYRTGILDLTQGEMGTRGDEHTRAQEAELSRQLMGVVHRENLKLPDTQVENTHENRIRVAEVLRRIKPKLVIAPWTGQQHPDHNKASVLVMESCFFSGLRKFPAGGEPFRPRKVIYYLPFRYDIKPDFLVDISEQFDKKMDVIKCYHTQFVDIHEYIQLTPYLGGFMERIKAYNSFLGQGAKTKYAEGFVCREPMIVDDVADMLVPTY
jgi:bacillithiol biosynthesis deacetylase BshB1